MNKKGSGLMNLMIVVILGIGLFTGFATFLGHNLDMADKSTEYDGEPAYDKSFGSLSHMQEHSAKIEEIGEDTQESMEKISESNILLAGLYLASGLLNLFQHLADLGGLTKGFIEDMFIPLQESIPGFSWIVGIIVTVIVIYIVFRVVEAISGRNKGI